jgi:hypothetical protein
VYERPDLAAQQMEMADAAGCGLTMSHRPDDLDGGDEDHHGQYVVP